MSIYQQNEPLRGIVMPSMQQLPTRFFKMIALVTSGIIALMIFFNYIFAVTRIGAGYTGVEILLSGGQRGASEIPIRTGWVFYSPLRSQIIEFPTYVQTVKWTKNLDEGRPQNEEMSFNSKKEWRYSPTPRCPMR